jgi:predicted phosphodiesterase
MKIAAITDIHGNLSALQAVLRDIDAEGVDCIVNCGDSLSGPLESAKTADLLMARAIPMIAGNHERQLLTLSTAEMNRSDACAAGELTERHRTWLAAAPPTRWLADDVFVCHGTPASDLNYWLETVTDDFDRNGSLGVRPASMVEVIDRLGDGEHRQRASLIICGHTHVPRVVQVSLARQGQAVSRAITIVNAGSVGLQGYDDEHPYPH